MVSVMVALGIMALGWRGDTATARAIEPLDMEGSGANEARDDAWYVDTSLAALVFGN